MLVQSIHSRFSWLLAVSVLAVGSACDSSGDDQMGDGPAPEDGSVRLTDAQVRSAGIVTSPVEARTIRRPVRVPGSVGTPDTAKAAVGSIVEGRIVVVHVLPGDQVRRGQALVEIHSHELSDAQKDLTAAEAQLAFHRNALERSQKLLDAGAVALEEVERRQADFAEAEAEVTRAEEMVEHLYPSTSGNVTAIAPRSGTVFQVDAQPGQAVLPGTPLLEMGSTRTLWVTAFVPENTSSSMRVGDTVAVTFRALAGVSVPARLVRTGNFVDPANRSVEMRFELSEIPEGVRPGSFAEVDVASSASFEGVELAEEAAVRVGEEDVVFVMQSPGVYHPVTVTAVALGGGRVAVTGVPPGAQVVTEGAYFIKAAMEAGGEEETGEGS